MEDGVDAEGVGDEHHDGDEQGHQAEDVVHLSLSNNDHHHSDCASWRPQSMLSLSPSTHGRMGIRRVEEKILGQNVTMQGTIYWRVSSNSDFTQNYFVLKRMFNFFDNRDKCRKPGF